MHDRLPLLIAIALLFTSAPIVSASKTLLGIDYERIEHIIDIGYNHDPSFENEIRQLAEEFPGSPVPALLDSGRLYWIQDYAEVDDELSEKFLDVVHEAISQSKKYLKENKGNSDAEFVLAMTQILEVKYFVDKGRYFAAFWHQRAPMKAMKRFVKENPEYHDAKMMLGMANCYLANAPGYLKPLAALMRFRGDMDLGLQYLNEAKQDGLFTKVDSAYFLSTVQAELLNDIPKAHREMLALSDRYPRNVRFQILLAQMERELKLYEQANDRALALLDEPNIERFVGLKMRVLSSLHWSSLEARRYELAVLTCDMAIDFIESDDRFTGWLPWTLNAKGEALRSLGLHEKAIEIFKSVAHSDNGAYEFAKNKLVEYAAEERISSEI